MDTERKLKEGDFIKVRIMGGKDDVPERVWCIVKSIDWKTQTIEAEINNTPIMEAWHLGDVIKVPFDYVLDAMSGDFAKERE